MDTPHIHDDYPGSIIGGTDIAILVRAKVCNAMRDHLLWFLSPDMHAGFISAHDGQPGL